MLHLWKYTHQLYIVIRGIVAVTGLLYFSLYIMLPICEMHPPPPGCLIGSIQYIWCSKVYSAPSRGAQSSKCKRSIEDNSKITSYPAWMYSESYCTAPPPPPPPPPLHECGVTIYVLIEKYGTLSPNDLCYPFLSGALVTGILYIVTDRSEQTLQSDQDLHCHSICIL